MGKWEEKLKKKLKVYIYIYYVLLYDWILFFNLKLYIFIYISKKDTYSFIEKNYNFLK